MNILDYIKWRGDLSFHQDPFNDIDNLLFASLAYCHFDGCFKEKKSLRLKEMALFFFELNSAEKLKDDKSFVSFAPEVLRAMSLCRRYQDCVLHDYVSVLNDCQFAAFTLDIDARYSVIAFRGTDDTLIGWKESLTLSYSGIAAQDEALKYLNEHLKAGRKYFITGHSKGGNLSLYAGVYVKPLLRKRIAGIYNNDGPGLMEGLWDEQRFKAIRERYHKFVPQFQVIGGIYDESINKLVVKANDIGLAQHNPLNWQLEGKCFVEVEEIEHIASVIGKTLMEYVKSTTVLQRKLLVDELFKHLNKAGIYNVSDFMKGGLTVVFKALVEFGRMDPSAKKVADMMLNSFFGVVESDLRERIRAYIA